MKKALSLGIMTTLLIVLFSGQKTTATQQPAQAEAFINYTWYYDMDGYQPVGTVSTVNAEMQRLRNLHPYYTFSAAPSLGLLEYEYGYFGYVYAFIYSDLGLSLNANSRDSAARKH
jgi:hypothetical protein